MSNPRVIGNLEKLRERREEKILTELKKTTKISKKMKIRKQTKQ